jgi:hypothetical protein
MSAGAFAAVFAALYAAHEVGDHWIQTPRQASGKGAAGWAGRWPCARHVAVLAAVKAAALGAMVTVTGLHLRPVAVVAALAADGASHYWADRRVTLQRLAAWLGRTLIPGKGEFWHLGAPRPGHDDAPHLGTGAYALDQSWHIGWLFTAALIAVAWAAS